MTKSAGEETWRVELSRGGSKVVADADGNLVKRAGDTWALWAGNRCMAWFVHKEDADQAVADHNASQSAGTWQDWKKLIDLANAQATEWRDRALADREALDVAVRALERIYKGHGKDEYRPRGLAIEALSNPLIAAHRKSKTKSSLQSQEGDEQPPQEPPLQ